MAPQQPARLAGLRGLDSRASRWTSQRLLYTPEGKPRIAIISIAHLGDAERMFFVTLLLNEIVALDAHASPAPRACARCSTWTRSSATSRRRANPPSKPPMLTLLKQARAFGLGVVLATQNPVDLDYKGLANAGTWFIGRLQTERDKARVLEGLRRRVSGGGRLRPRASWTRLMSALTQRVFLMRNVHEDAPVLLKTRWALSYLRGPLTAAEISAADGAAQGRVRGNAAAALPLPVRRRATAPRGGARCAAPVLPAERAEYFLPPRAAAARSSTARWSLGAAKLHFVDAKLGLDSWQTHRGSRRSPTTAAGAVAEGGAQ